MEKNILLVDDDIQSLHSTEKILKFSGFNVTTAPDGQEALKLLQTKGSHFSAVVTDVRMPRLSGIEFLKALHALGKKTPVILMSAFGQIEEAVWAMKHGAVDFLIKPFKKQDLLSAVDNAFQRIPLEESHEEKTLLLGQTPAMKEIRVMIDQVSLTNASVLITGESGTGKELVARTIHAKSKRASGPFMALNCAAIPDTLIESELFGHEKGAFSGAVQKKKGLFEAAHQGTLLLDEIGDMPLSLQAKLLRALQEGEVRRVGSTESQKFDVRIIASSHHDFEKKVKEGSFRQDLLFRLDVIRLHLPPLRERKEDIFEIAKRFLSDSSKKHQKNVQGLDQDFLAILLKHDWPGNVRELYNVIERAIIFSNQSVLTPKEIPSHLRVEKSNPKMSVEVSVGTALKEVEDLMIQKTLEATSGDKQMAAKLLGVNSRTIYRKLEKKEKLD